MSAQQAGPRDLVPVRKPASAGEAVADAPIAIEGGQYWRRKGEGPGPEGVPPGEVLLVRSTQVLDGHVHTVVLHDHPMRQAERTRHHKETTLHMLAGAFVAGFEPCDGERVRGEEIARIERRLRDEERAYEQLKRTEGRALLQYTPEREAATTRHTMLEQAKHQGQSLERLRGASALAATRIREALTELAPYRNEHLIAIQARHEEATREMREAEEAQAMLRLYTGDDVERIEWVQGEPADAHELITVFQRVRYVDEESLFHVLDGDGEGAGADDLQTFVETLAGDEALRRRVAPAQRSIVAIQPRRRKRYRTDDHPQWGEERDVQTVLLVRNGERWSTLHWAMGTATRLIPTRNEWEAMFIDRWAERRDGGRAGSEPARIGIEDVRFVETLRRADRAMRQHLRAWVVIAGAQLRDDILGPLGAEVQVGRPLNLMNREDQTLTVNLVHDEEDALDMALTAFAEQRARWNAQAHAGGRVVIDPRRAVTTHQRAWYTASELSRRWDREPRPKFAPGTTPIIATVRNARGGALTARVKTHCGHTLPLILHPHAHWWLWVEDADEKTLWDYVRHARREYRTVMPLAMPAAKQLGTDTREAERAGASDAIENNAIRFLRPLKRGGLAGRRARAPLTAMLRRSGAQLRKAIEGVLHAPVLAARVEHERQITAWTGPREGTIGAGALRWALEHGVRIELDGSLTRDSADPKPGIIRPGRWLVAPADNVADTLHDPLRAMTFEQVSRAQQRVIEAGTAWERWTRALNEDPNVLGALRRAVSERRGRERRHRPVLWWPVGLAHPSEGKRSVGELAMVGIGIDGLALIRWAASTRERPIEGSERRDWFIAPRRMIAAQGDDGAVPASAQWIGHSAEQCTQWSENMALGELCADRDGHLLVGRHRWGWQLVLETQCDDPFLQIKKTHTRSKR